MPERYLPALRWHALTPLFDPVARVTTRERTFKRRLLDTAQVKAGEAVLDLGCGTGTLAIAQKQRCAGARVVGLDADPKVLARAHEKAAAESVDVEFVEALSTELPFPDVSFDVVLSTLFFHHLDPATKRDTVAEVRRVLVPGGRFYVGDYGRPSDPLMRAAFLTVRVFDGFEVTRDNVRGALPQLFEAGGLQDARLHDRLRTPLGTLAVYEADKPA